MGVQQEKQIPPFIWASSFVRRKKKDIKKITRFVCQIDSIGKAPFTKMGGTLFTHDSQVIQLGNMGIGHEPCLS
ncbi:MAG: hypothetical protein PHE47_00270 [Oscillospiraceae bacterium]|nr:hypothetical protein [Oscillospiraceae bacterium]